MKKVILVFLILLSVVSFAYSKQSIPEEFQGTVESMYMGKVNRGEIKEQFSYRKTLFILKEDCVYFPDKNTTFKLTKIIKKVESMDDFRGLRYYFYFKGLEYPILFLETEDGLFYFWPNNKSFTNGLLFRIGVYEE